MFNYHKTFLLSLCFSVSTPLVKAESTYDKLIKYGGGGLLVGITCGLLLKKLNHTNTPKDVEPQTLSVPTIRNYMTFHFPVIHVLRCIVSKSENTIKSIQLNVLHPYNEILDHGAIEQTIITGLSLHQSTTIQVIQEVNEDAYSSYELNAIRNYIESTYPNYTCLNLSKDYQGITLTLKHDDIVDSQALEKELRAALSMPSTIDLSVEQA